MECFHYDKKKKDWSRVYKTFNKYEMILAFISSNTVYKIELKENLKNRTLFHWIISFK